MARIVLEPKGERCRSMLPTLTRLAPDRLVELALEGDDLARVGVGAGRLAGRLRVGEVLAMTTRRRSDCASQARGADPQGAACSGSTWGYTFALASSMRWKALATLVLSL